MKNAAVVGQGRTPMEPTRDRIFHQFWCVLAVLGCLPAIENVEHKNPTLILVKYGRARNERLKTVANVLGEIVLGRRARGICQTSISPWRVAAAMRVFGNVPRGTAIRAPPLTL